MPALTPLIVDQAWTWEVASGTSIRISAAGVQGPTGATGPQGPQGPAGAAGTTDHTALSNLAFATSGHTGFAGTGVANTFTAAQTAPSWIGNGAMLTFLGARLDIHNVLDYGAVGDGVADDTAAIQAAITAAAVLGGVVYLPARVYLAAGTLTIPVGGNVSLWGANRGNQTISDLGSTSPGTILRAGNTLDTVMLQFDGGLGNPVNSGLVIQDITFDGTSNGGTAPVDRKGGVAIDLIRCAYFTITRCTIRMFRIAGIRLTGSLVGTVSECWVGGNVVGVLGRKTTSGTNIQSNLNKFRDCRFQFNDYAFTFDRCAMILFDGCDFEVNGGANSDGTGIGTFTNACPNGEGTGLVMQNCWGEGNHGRWGVLIDEPLSHCHHQFTGWASYEFNSPPEARVRVNATGSFRNDVIVLGAHPNGGASGAWGTAAMWAFSLNGANARTIRTNEDGDVDANDGTDLVLGAGGGGGGGDAFLNGPQTFTGEHTFDADDPAVTPLTVRANAAQSDPIFAITDASANRYFWTAPDGDMIFGRHTGTSVGSGDFRFRGFNSLGQAKDYYAGVYIGIEGAETNFLIQSPNANGYLIMTEGGTWVLKSPVSITIRSQLTNDIDNFTIRPNNSAFVGLVIQRRAGQSEPIQTWNSETSNTSADALSSVRKNGELRLVHLADATAENDSYYFSTDANKPVYKDAAGVVTPFGSI
jgi:hypothetical protein